MALINAIVEWSGLREKSPISREAIDVRFRRGGHMPLTLRSLVVLSVSAQIKTEPSAATSASSLPPGRLSDWKDS
jgi:hypothetical protein